MWPGRDWVELATAWARDRLAEAGITLVGPAEQVRLEPWSAVLRLPTSDGSYFFKAVTAVHVFEPALTALLARTMPEYVVDIVAIDEERRWMLSRDAGTRLRELVSDPGHVALWEQALPRYAELQIATAPRCDELLALGVPDMRLSLLPALFERVLGDADALLVGRPEGLTPDDLDALRSRADSFAADCEELAACAVPEETIQHDDLHDGNVFVADGRYVFFDWGDACVSHPFTTLVVTLRALAWKLGLEPGGAWATRLRDAYLEAWKSNASRRELDDSFALAYRIGTVARGLAWYRMLAGRDPRDRAEDAESVPYGLKLWLAGGPIGSWS